jgi:hypothetical protein
MNPYQWETIFTATLMGSAGKIMGANTAKALVKQAAAIADESVKVLSERAQAQGEDHENPAGDPRPTGDPGSAGSGARSDDAG